MLFQSLTGSPKTSFDNILNFVDPGEHCKKLMFYDPSRGPDRSEENKYGRRPKILPADQLCSLCG